MTYTINDPIFGASIGTPADVFAWLTATSDEIVSGTVREYVTEIYRLCRLVGLRADLLVSQSAHETDDWTSYWWRTRKNPAGLGITGDEHQNADSQTWANGVEAARAHMVHMAAYLGREYAELTPFYALDPRRTAVIEAGYAGTMHSLSDLTGKWAVDPRYAEKIAAKANRIFGSIHQEVEPAMTNVTFGKVPKPDIIDLICPKPYEGAGFYRVPPRKNVGICEHITDGHGSIEWYHDFFSTGGERAEDALVDFIVGRDGRIGMLNDWRGTRAPWANGNLLGLEGDGPAFLKHFGVDAVNTKLVSIEHEGRAAEDWTPAQWNASVALDAWLFDQMGVRFDSFPVHQGYGIVTHLLHSEFTNKGGNGLDECPGRYLKQHVAAFQSDIRAVLMAHQVDATPVPKPKPPVTPPVYVEPDPLPWPVGTVGWRQLNGTSVYALVAEVEVVKRGGTKRFRSANPNGAQTGPKLPQGEKVTAIGSFRDSGPKPKRWAILSDGSRVEAANCRPLLPVAP